MKFQTVNLHGKGNFALKMTVDPGFFWPYIKTEYLAVNVVTLDSTIN